LIIGSAQNAPAILHKFSNPNETLMCAESIDVLPDFCFPDGLCAQKIDYDFTKELHYQSQATQDVIQDLLYR
jgi:hypothetical protein